MTPACAEIRLSLGSYVLGALDPGERGQVEAHVSSCADCRDELASLAALPGLLARVSLPEVTATPADVDAALLPRLLARVTAMRRRRRARWLISTAAGVVVLAAVISGVVVVAHPGPSSGIVARGWDPATGITAAVNEWPRAWGTALQIQLSGETTGAYDGRCQLIVIGTDGRREVAASWTATPSGHIVAAGATSMRPAEIASFHVVRSDGTVLVAVTPPAAAR